MDTSSAHEFVPIFFLSQRTCTIAKNGLPTLFVIKPVSSQFFKYSSTTTTTTRVFRVQFKYCVLDCLLPKVLLPASKKFRLGFKKADKSRKEIVGIIIAQPVNWLLGVYFVLLS